MEQVALALPITGDANEIWDEFLDDDTKRIRAKLQRVAPVNQEISALLAQQQELQRMLAEHQLAKEAIESMLASLTVSDWKANEQPWKALAQTNRFTASDDKQSTGMRFMGWHDSRRVDVETGSFQFSLHKIFKGYDLDYYMASGWHVYTDTKVYERVTMGQRGKAIVDILQELTPRLAVVLFHERYEGLDINAHSLNLLATVETNGRVTQFIRSVETPELMLTFDHPDDLWVSKFYWRQFDNLDPTKPRDSTDFRVSVRGSLRGNDTAYLIRCMVEALGAVLRDEMFSSGRELLTFDD